MGADLGELEAKLGHVFRDRSLLVRALTHRSFTSELRPERLQPDNEQLEFFGDAILGFIVSETLLERHPGLAEGRLSRAKSHMVCERHLHQVAQTMGVGEYLQLGRGEEHSGGRGKASLLANALEALIAAIYLDAGLEAAQRFILEHVYSDAHPVDAERDHANFKGRLWERAGAGKLPKPEYLIIDTSGPAHAPHFTVEARLGSLVTGRGEGGSKKKAEQQAAKAVLDALESPAV